MSLDATDARLRAICLALPEAAEEPHAARPVVPRRGQDLRPRTAPERLACALVQVPEGSREILLAAEPARFFIPPYFGSKGWIGVGLDEAAEWREIEAFVRRSYRLIAPKRLAKLIA